MRSPDQVKEFMEIFNRHLAEQHSVKHAYIAAELEWYDSKGYNFYKTYESFRVNKHKFLKRRKR